MAKIAPSALNRVTKLAKAETARLHEARMLKLLASAHIIARTSPEGATTKVQAKTRLRALAENKGIVVSSSRRISKQQPALLQSVSSFKAGDLVCILHQLPPHRTAFKVPTIRTMRWIVALATPTEA